MNSWKSITVFGSLIVAFAVGVFVLFSTVEWLDASHLLVIQYPNGALQAFTEPGPQPQWFGTTHTYRRRVQFSFNNAKGCTQIDPKGFAPFKIRFNDGGHADICGALSWEMPLTKDELIRLQKEFGSEEAIDQQLVSKALNNAVYFAGPLMSSIESAGERRPELFQVIEDQAKNGVFQMVTREVATKDPITGQDKQVRVVEIAMDPKTKQPIRSAASAVGGYGISFAQFTISDIVYDNVVESQIKSRQDAINSVQVAIANSKRAQQDALTVAAQYEAKVAESKGKQDVEKAQQVTLAQQQLEVAQLAAKAAEQTKQQQILLGQGEAQRRQLVMSADGALDKKLEALVKINGFYADAIAKYQGHWVPNVVMGAAGGANQGLALIDLLTAKTARDLGMDMSVTGKDSTKK